MVSVRWGRGCSAIRNTARGARRDNPPLGEAGAEAGAGAEADTGGRVAGDGAGGGDRLTLTSLLSWVLLSDGNSHG